MTALSSSTLFRGGHIYAPGTPRASAMLIDGVEVVWVGTDEAAERLGRPDAVVDLNGALVVPAFVDAHVPWPTMGDGSPSVGEPAAEAVGAMRQSAAASGIASLHLMAPPALAGDDVADLLRVEHPGADLTVYRPEPADRADEVLRDATTGGRQAAFLVEDAAGLDEVLAVAARLVERVGLSNVVVGRHRVQLAGAAAAAADEGDETVRARPPELARLGLVATVQPLLAEQARLSQSRPPPALHALATAGVPFAFGGGSSVQPWDPWGAVRVASSAAWGTSALSARAAFAAATRGGRRAARQDREGAVRPGAPATFAVWDHTGDLVVRTPDARVAAWSTDPRAATPGLPDLTGEGPGPACRLTVIRGAVGHDDGFLSASGR